MIADPEQGSNVGGNGRSTADAAGEAHLAALQTGAAWPAHAAELARWTWEHLVNRTDVWGAYLPLHRRSGDNKVYTAPAKSQRGKVVLTEAILARHYAGADQGHLTGLHSTSAANTSRWGG